MLDEWTLALIISATTRSWNCSPHMNLNINGMFTSVDASIQNGPAERPAGIEEKDAKQAFFCVTGR